MHVDSSSHTHPTKRESKAEGISLGCVFEPGPRLNTFKSKGLSLPATLATNSRFSKPVACSRGSPRVTRTKF